MANIELSHWHSWKNSFVCTNYVCVACREACVLSTNGSSLNWRNTRGRRCTYPCQGSHVSFVSHSSRTKLHSSRHQVLFHLSGGSFSIHSETIQFVL